jgi:hypothetical protein
MEGLARKPFQGVLNIVRFNWHFYLIAAAIVICMLVLTQFVSPVLSVFINLFVCLVTLSTLVSLAISYYVYDCSDLYSLRWLDFLNIKPGSRMVSINAGFDETSVLLSQKFAGSPLSVFDFYDPAKHTEISIERARKAYPVFPGTIQISTSAVPGKAGSSNYIFAILAAHEIRKTDERVLFFQQLKEMLTAVGKIIVVEHLRDVPNFLAYNLGFFHFFSKTEWKHTFKSSGLSIDQEIKITPFISAFILKHGTTS